MDKQERMILLSRLQAILRYVAWEELKLDQLEPLRTEVDVKILKLKEEQG